MCICGKCKEQKRLLDKYRKRVKKKTQTELNELNLDK